MILTCGENHHSYITSGMISHVQLLRNEFRAYYNFTFFTCDSFYGLNIRARCFCKELDDAYLLQLFSTPELH